MEYPYLGYRKVDNEKMVVVLFTSKDTGVVVHTETQGPMYRFGKNAEFDEEDFLFLPAEQYVTLNN